MSENHPVGVRLDARTRQALDDAAIERGMRATALARHLIACGLDTVDATMSIRRRPSPIQGERVLQAVLLELGRIGGNLQRIYTTLVAGGRQDDELLKTKADLRAIADRLRAALRAGPPA